MTPVLTSTNYDYDYDAVQPYFLDGEEEDDFYPPPRSQLLPGPGEDIWKKFELLPTPPLSPSRRPPNAPPPVAPPPADLLDEGPSPSAALLQSFIIQDCMWSSSFAAATKLEKVVYERLALLRSRRDSSNNNNNNNNDNNAATDGAAAVPVGREQVATDCVDPSAVLQDSALRGRSVDGAAMEAGSELCLDSLRLGGSDGESEEEEEEEEIDVVTIDRRKASPRSSSSPLVLKRCHVNVDQHNYAAAPRPSTQSAGKRLRSEFTCASGGRRCGSPRSEEEEEDNDGDRRTTHNVLERQRRNELKMSFAALRDEVPAVANNEKTAKVSILKRATAFVNELREDERRLQTVKEELRRRSRATKRRLAQLRTLR